MFKWFFNAAVTASTSASMRSTRYFDDFIEKNKNAIESYLKEHKLNATATSTGLYYLVEKEGNGKSQREEVK